jgi:hypothetical protein
MAGPALGRLLKSTLKEKFVSANLPMLHHRTVDDTGTSEFRPGVKQTESSISLGDEFIRQFYGDVMLFSIAELAGNGFPRTVIGAEKIRQEINRQHDAILGNYADKHEIIMALMQQLQTIVSDDRQWWHNDNERGSDTRTAINDIQYFLDNIKNNFSQDSAARQILNDKAHAEVMLDKLVDEINRLPGQLDYWQLLCSNPAAIHETRNAARDAASDTLDSTT